MRAPRARPPRPLGSRKPLVFGALQPPSEAHRVRCAQTSKGCTKWARAHPNPPLTSILFCPSRYTQIFVTLQLSGPDAGDTLNRRRVMPCLRKSGLADEQLTQVWRLADTDGDGRLDGDQFVLAMHLANWVVKSRAPLPEVLPATMTPAAGLFLG